MILKRFVNFDSCLCGSNSQRWEALEAQQACLRNPPRIVHYKLIFLLLEEPKTNILSSAYSFVCSSANQLLILVQQHLHIYTSKQMQKSSFRLRTNNVIVVLDIIDGIIWFFDFEWFYCSYEWRKEHKGYDQKDIKLIMGPFHGFFVHRFQTSSLK